MKSVNDVQCTAVTYVNQNIMKMRVAPTTASIIKTKITPPAMAPALGPALPGD